MSSIFLREGTPLAFTIDLNIDIKYQEQILITIIHQFITYFDNYIGSH